NKAVIVKNLPASYTGDSEHLQLFFESKKRVGRELDVQDVQIVNNAEAMGNGSSKKESTQVKEESQSGNYLESAEVGGFRDCATFEDDYNSVVNKRKSGEGDILDVQVDREGRKAHITFLEKSDASEVVSRTHSLSDCDHTVVPFIISKDLPNNISEDSLENYIGAKVRGSKVRKITFNQNMDKAVVLFAENIDIQNVRDACSKHAIDGHHLKPKCIPVTTSI
ncbi:hypothetical protein MAR_016306, partial [Mya arenaria]